MKLTSVAADYVTRNEVFTSIFKSEFGFHQTKQMIKSVEDESGCAIKIERFNPKGN